MYSVISSGPDKGKRLYPHLHQDGYYVASTSRFEKDYIKVKTLDELEALVRSGYGARLKATDSNNAPSIITSSSIKFEEDSTRSQTPKTLLPAVVFATDLDPESITTRRREQAFLRAYLLKEKSTGSCTICGHSLPHDLLIAAHIKTRSKCSSEEKLDFDNVATLMCSLGCDALFEGHYIYIEHGKVTLNRKKTYTEIMRLKASIDSVTGNLVNNWEGSNSYYEWHKSQCLRA
ncbi:hypothetical protein K5D69_24130 [Pseudomonas cichorii]|uniref:hypothetical protein n=1 Tax=Pseudomonas cichorii TaxID=36746 RepID=UPI001C8AAE68|nr:hypothetical protein [Pseudomonas cichorii]MBX8517771.1 hypothetical protein [Pseudomonas cichorii]